MGKTIFCCVCGLLALTLYLFIVVSFNQEYEYHTGIPVSIYVTGSEKTLRMGFFVKIEFDAYLISSTIELTFCQV